MKKLTGLILSAAAALMLCGCSGLFEEEYVYVSDYVSPVQNAGSQSGDKTTVTSPGELRQILLAMVAAGETERSIVFDAAYSGNTTEDLDSACWQVRTQDALCAYCVENISYEVNQIVTYYEAEIRISYSSMALHPESIVNLQYSTGVEEIIKNTIEAGQTHLVVLIELSSYSAEAVQLLVSRVYQDAPGIAPREPSASVNLYSGTGMQRLYDIRLSYGMSAEELESRRAAMDALEPFAGLETDSMSDGQKALAACRYLTENCQYVEEMQVNNIYSALVTGQAGSVGMALAYVELCNRLGVECQLVRGQRNWQDYTWNIVCLDGEYYHVDPAVCAVLGMEEGFLLRDAHMWGTYRWDMSSYPTCTGELDYWELAGIPNKSQEPGENGDEEETDPDAGEPSGNAPGEVPSNSERPEEQEPGANGPEEQEPGVNEPEEIDPDGGDPDNGGQEEEDSGENSDPGADF